jgi:hypothetical protein
MTQEIKVRKMRVVDFVAESLEAEANAMPLSYKAQADILRKQAQVYRGMADQTMVTVRERRDALLKEFE